MSIDKIRSEVTVKPIIAKVDSNVPKSISWLIERKPIPPARYHSGLFRSRSQDLTTYVTREAVARDRPRTAESLSESLFPSGVYWLPEYHHCRRDTTGDRIEQLEREKTELRSLIERLMAEADVQRCTYRKQLEVISQLQNENERLREQRKILLTPTECYQPRQRIGDFLSGDLDTIMEDQILRLCIVNNQFKFEEMRKCKRNREKQKSPSVRRYYV